MKSLYSLATLVAIASPLAAQRTQVWETTPRSGTIERTPGMAYTYTTSRRAIIGVSVDTRPNDNDTLGATIASVTPGGPAARAGLLGGDIVTKVNGTALADRRSRNDDEDNNSTPGLRMVEVLARLSPGDTATVEWKRGTERNRRTARIVTEAAAGMLSSAGPDIRIYTDEGPGRFKFNFDDAPRQMIELQGRLEALRGPMAMTLPRMDGQQVFFRVGGPFGGVQFAPLNEDLGHYFGTTEGVLVLETPDSSAHVDLKGGDVILAVGDRKPTSVEHLFRILGSYEDDESVSFDVMRDKRRITITAKAEDIRGGGRMRILEDRLRPTTVPDMAPPESDRPAPARPAPRRAPRSGT